MGVPVQPAAVGVIVYVAVPALVPVAFNVCAIDEPEPFDAPLTPDWETVQANVAPPVLLVNATDVAPPEQIVCVEGVAVTPGAGLTVTVAVMFEPAQPPTEGVIVYVAVPGLAPVAVKVCVIEVPELLLAPLVPD